MIAKRFMLDTNTVSYLLRDRTMVMQNRLLQAGVGNVCISAITEAELLYGLQKNPSALHLKELVDSFLSHVDSMPWDSTAAQAYAELRHRSKKMGIALSNMDMLIGAHAIAIDTTFITNDGAFSHFSKWITLDNWIGE